MYALTDYIQMLLTRSIDDVYTDEYQLYKDNTNNIEQINEVKRPLIMIESSGAEGDRKVGILWSRPGEEV